MSHNGKVIEIPCDALLFDLDGVLVDSSRTIEHHWRMWAARRQIDLDEVLRNAHGRRTVETIRIVAPHLDAEAEAAALDAAETVDTSQLAMIDGAPRLLGSIPSSAWAVATSGPRQMAITRLSFAGLPIPKVLISGQDVKNGKPDPEPFLAAAAGLGIAPSKCVVIEDAPAGIQAARSAGMRVIAVASTHPAEDLSQADVITRRLADIEMVARQGVMGSRCRVWVKTIC